MTDVAWGLVGVAVLTVEAVALIWVGFDLWYQSVGRESRYVIWNPYRDCVYDPDGVCMVVGHADVLPF